MTDFQAIPLSKGLPVALYIHIPFCAVRCQYCDFNTYAGLERYFEPYTAALIGEIRQAGAAAGRPAVRTIFIGGGTPTVLPPDLLAQVLSASREAFDVAPDAEITSEANPGTVDRAHFAALRSLGVNRLSMGVQSFDDDELRWLGRIHSAQEAVDAFEAARTAGFSNLNLDFMFGLPDQRPASWQRTLAQALSLGPEHLSLYSLIVEPGTPLADRVRRGQVAEPDDDVAADLYLSAMETLAAHGYIQYEISNWARETGPSNRQLASRNQHPTTSIPQPVTSFQLRASSHQLPASGVTNPSYASQHNLVYWHNEPYLGFGAGAHSFDGVRRWWNVRPVPKYLQRLEHGQSPEAGGEAIDTRLAQGETMMVGLRLVREGVADARFRARFGSGLAETFGREIDELTRRGLVEFVAGHLRLTPHGRLLGNQAFAMFLPDD